MLSDTQTIRLELVINIITTIEFSTSYNYPKEVASKIIELAMLLENYVNKGQYKNFFEGMKPSQIFKDEIKEYITELNKFKCNKTVDCILAPNHMGTCQYE